ncbi:MAG: BCD family MFS transporter [Myxococcota bacterium]|nr:BCD family MFS transporter [Myxococcota bacterium]
MDARGSETPLGWLGIARLGLVQSSLGAIVILTTSTLNRVMVVELVLPAVLPGALVGWHYAVQLSRPRWGYGSDVGGARTPWIVGGMVVLALSAVLAAASTAWMAHATALGIASAFVAFLGIGIGVGACGTNLLALLATRTEPSRKAAAAAIVWIMMICGFVVTASLAGQLLDPFSMQRLLMVTAGVSAIAVCVCAVAVWGLERPSRGRSGPAPSAARPAFRAALGEVWEEPQARRFTVFVFVSMLAYSAQDLILEPFAGLIHGYTPGESTQLAGLQHGGVLAGMLLTAVVGTTLGRSRARFMRIWTVGGCIASALALAALASGATAGPGWPLKPSVFALGLANGAFAVAAIGSMMTLASAGRPGREGTRMGLWGASQAIAFGLGGFLGAAAVDAARALLPDPATAFAIVFGAEGIAFLAAAWLAARVGRTQADDLRLPVMPAGEPVAAESRAQ